MTVTTTEQLPVMTQLHRPPSSRSPLSSRRLGVWVNWTVTPLPSSSENNPLHFTSENKLGNAHKYPNVKFWLYPLETEQPARKLNIGLSAPFSFTPAYCDLEYVPIRSFVFGQT